MTTLPEEAVKAYIKAFGNTPRTKAMAVKNEQKVRHALTAALPFLPVQGAVKKLAWTKGVVDIAQPMPGMKYVACNTTPKGSWAWWLDNAPETRGVFTSEEAAKAAAQADYERRILAAIEAAPPLSKLKAENARLKAQLAEARKALDGLLKPFEGDDCRYDHHGYCQAHFLQEVDECCVKIARRALAGGQEDG